MKTRPRVLTTVLSVSVYRRCGETGRGSSSTEGGPEGVYRRCGYTGKGSSSTEGGPEGGSTLGLTGTGVGGASSAPKMFKKRQYIT